MHRMLEFSHVPKGSLIISCETISGEGLRQNALVVLSYRGYNI
jgi:hypothetical protein